MAVIPAGSLLYQRGRGPGRSVSLSVPFALSVYEVTFEDYDRFNWQKGMASDEGWGRGRRPAINVSWDDANEYVTWLSAETGADYRLPNEVEWQYAARAGMLTKYSWGEGIGINRANCLGAGPPPVVGDETVGADEGKDVVTDEDYFRALARLQAGVVDRESDWGLAGTVACYDTWWTTAPVGSFAANDFGLYDMHGNVSEWVVEGPGSYPDWVPEHLRGADWVPVVCGGSHIDVPYELEAGSCSRHRRSPKDMHIDVGFRVALTLGP